MSVFLAQDLWAQEELVLFSLTGLDLYDFKRNVAFNNN